MSKETLRGLSLFNLTGRCAVVTGGSKGLGLAMAAGLASAGADLLLVSRHAEEADAAAAAQDTGHSEVLTSNPARPGRPGTIPDRAPCARHCTMWSLVKGH